MSIISVVQHAASSLPLFNFPPRSLRHLAGTLCREISHCVVVMEKEGEGRGWVGAGVRDNVPQNEKPPAVAGRKDRDTRRYRVRGGGGDNGGSALHSS